MKPKIRTFVLNHARALRQSAASLRLPAAGALLITFLATSPLHASTVWDGGGTSGGWGVGDNWSDNIAPTFTNTSDLSFPTSSVTQFNTFLGASRIVRSLSFGADVDSPLSVSFQTAAGGATGANLTFDTDAIGGNATVTVDSDATGEITLGSALAGTNLNPILADNLVVNHNGSACSSSTAHSKRVPSASPRMVLERCRQITTTFLPALSTSTWERLLQILSRPPETISTTFLRSIWVVAPCKSEPALVWRKPITSFL